MGIDTVPEWGALSFGAIIGWYVYYINRYRKGDVGIGDITSVIGAIGGASVTGLFGGPDLFGAYGIGLGIGFFTYFLVLILLVGKSDNFDSDWFLDGRRKNPAEGMSIPGDVRSTVASMTPNPGGFYGTNPAGMIQPANVAQFAPFVVQPVVLTPSRVEPVPLPQPAHLPMPASALNPNAQKVLDACKGRWDANKKDCNAFVKAVAADCKVVIAADADADAIVSLVTGAGWRREADGPAALKAAQEGRLVIGGLSGADLGDDHGHVVVVVAVGLEKGLYPSAYWGTLSYDNLDDDKKSWGGSGKGVNWSFDKDHRDLVKYGSIAI
ncbi:hypothetical protein [Mesorhizobium sp.]|uniref:hypothetical protein n=1 Tax=Mesorhizobium sp. TaxID=1871066 RepID=UPI000FE785CA|nr:hypothetical protein [Mesorhizobium sp.]RWP51084.1 MAG: hypothetical protein EOR05_03970 [Mesorhizobium sp.]